MVLIDGMAISVVTREDLVLSKLAWFVRTGSEMQERDIRNLLAAGCDLDYIRSADIPQEQKDALTRILKDR